MSRHFSKKYSRAARGAVAFAFLLIVLAPRCFRWLGKPMGRVTPALTPTLSPEEREARSAASGKTGLPPSAAQLTRVDGPVLEAPKASAPTKTRRTFLPLPGGEDWGEGGRHSDFYLRVIFQNAKIISRRPVQHQSPLVTAPRPLNETGSPHAGLLATSRAFRTARLPKPEPCNWRSAAVSGLAA